MAESQQLTLWTQEALESLQEALGEAAAARRKRRGPPKGEPVNKGAWGDLATDTRRDTDPSKFTRAELRRMFAREEFVGVIGRETRRKQSAVERCNFHFNRLIESRFPDAQFSEMDYIPSGCALYSGHGIESEDE